MRVSGERLPSAETVAAWAVGIGVGLMVLMVTWLIGNRLFGLFLEAPSGPTVAFGVAIAVGAVTAVVASRRLVTVSSQ